MGSNKKLDKYNQKEKLEKEEKNMEDSTAKLIAGNDKQEPAKLQDFKSRIIDDTNRSNSDFFKKCTFTHHASPQQVV